VLILGTWHPFKMACELIQQTFLFTFFGPAFHSLWPEFTILKKMKLPQILHLFNLVLFSYKYWKKDFIELWKEQCINNPLQKHENHLWKFRLLLDYFIPVVLDYGNAIRTKDFQNILRLQLNLAIVFYLLRGNNVQVIQYCRCVLMNLHFMTGLLLIKHPVIQVCIQMLTFVFLTLFYSS
jgi:hypothetical protein